MTDLISATSRRPLLRTKAKVNGWTKARRKTFLDSLAATCNVRASVAAAGMGSESAYALRRRDPAFAALWREALALGYERLEEALLEHALDGVNAIEIDIAPMQLPVTPEGAAPLRYGPGKRPVRRTPGEPDVALAMMLLRHHRGEVKDAKPARARRATEDETNAALMKKLDTLARQRENKS